MREDRVWEGGEEEGGRQHLETRPKPCSRCAFFCAAENCGPGGRSRCAVDAAGHRRVVAAAAAAAAVSAVSASTAARLVPCIAKIAAAIAIANAMHLHDNAAPSPPLLRMPLPNNIAMPA